MPEFYIFSIGSKNKVLFHNQALSSSYLHKKALGPLPAALFTNSASLKGLIFLVALLNIDKTDKQIELTVSAGDHSISFTKNIPSYKMDRQINPFE